MAMSWNDFTPYKVLRWYNSARREAVGGYCKIFTEYNMQNATVNEFHLNGTGTSSSNRNTVTLFTWANGVHTDLEYYITQQQYSGYTRYNLQGRFILRDKEDTILVTETGVSIYSDTRAGSTLDDFILYGTPGWATYSGERIYNITGFFGVIIAPIGPNYRQNPAGHVYTDSQFFDRFTAKGFQTVVGAESFNTNLALIVDNGDDTPITPILPSDDTSGTGGGDAGNPDYNPFTDPIPFPDLPTFSALTSGLISAYNPSINALNMLGEKLWSDNFFDEIKKINNDPMEAVISLHLLPFEVPAPSSANCFIGNYDSGISMQVITTQFMTVEGGQVQVNERFASALDYSPYTTAHIHIPFVGFVPLDIDYIMRKNLHLKYQVDVLTGSAVAMLMCDNAILYSFPCNMAMTIPLTSSNHQALYRQVINTSAQLGHTVVGAASPTTDKSGVPTAGAVASVGHGIVSSLESALNTVASKHSEVQKSGVITGAQGILGSYETYLIFHRPVQSLANNFAHFKGFPCNVTYTLSSLSGYTEVEYAHLEGVTALDAEKNEIQALLQSGVIL